jgi:4-azaleucine resistance transporter AzlC
MNAEQLTPHRKSPLALAFQLSLPIFLSYFPLGIVFGALFTKLPTHSYLGLIMSVVAYSGAVQFVTLGLLHSRASYVFIFLSVIFIAGRNAFYGLSLLKRYQMPKLKKLFAIFTLVDTNYALLLETPPYADEKKDHSFCLWLGFFPYFYWVMGTSLGALFGQHLPGVNELEFVLVAFFAIMLLEQYRKARSLTPVLVGLFGFAVALLTVGAGSLILLSIIISCALLLLINIFRSGAA